MQAVSYSTARNNLKHYMEQVNDDAESVIITSRRGARNAVLVSQAEYDNLIENAYIRRSRANVERIMHSWADLKAGKGGEHDWDGE